MESLAVRRIVPQLLIRQGILSLSASSNFHTTASDYQIRKMSRLRVVDNSEIGKQVLKRTG